MKILLVCAGGFSTSIIMKKVRRWSEENGKQIIIEAAGKEAYKDIWTEFNCILTGPQISYAIDEILEEVSIPVASIDPMDYALGNVENIVKLATNITTK